MINIYVVGVDDAEGPPVPIPNTEVKLSGAEDTWLATARENRKTPTLSYSSIAQLVEHAAVNRRVVGSSPTWGAKKNSPCNAWTVLFCSLRCIQTNGLVFRQAHRLLIALKAAAAGGRERRPLKRKKQGIHMNSHFQPRKYR